MHVLKQILTTEVNWTCRHCDARNLVKQFEAGRPNLLSCVKCHKGAIVDVVLKDKVISFGKNNELVEEMRQREQKDAKSGKSKKYFVEEM